MLEIIKDVVSLHGTTKTFKMAFQQTNPDLEELIIKALAAGLIQPEIVELFKKQNITPNSPSIIEKTIRRIREEHKANTLFQLALILQKKGLIK